MSTGNLLRVKIESGGGDNKKPEHDLGNFVFQRFPDRGDRIVLYSEEEFKTVEIIRFEHHPLEDPIAFPNETTWRKTSRTTLLVDLVDEPKERS